MTPSNLPSTSPLRIANSRWVGVHTWARPFEEALAAALALRRTGTHAVLVRLAGQPYPTWEQQALLVNEDLHLISVPDRVAERDTPDRERKLLMQRAYAKFRRAQSASEKPVTLVPHVNAQRTPGGELPDAERRAWLNLLEPGTAA